MAKLLTTSNRNVLRRTAILLILFVSSYQAFSQGKTAADTTALIKNEGDDLINIGYGKLKNRELNSPVTNLKSDEFNRGNINDPLQLIQGKVAGLSVNKVGGNPNESYFMRLRGMTTVNGESGPLIVVDGIPGASLKNTDPVDIETMVVLKDAAACAIYGVRGSGGVILITTKRGKADKTLIEYNVYATTEMVAKNEPVMNAEQWRTLSAEEKRGTDFGSSTNWFNETEQTALSQAHNLSLSGGSDKTNYRASINYRTGNGCLKKTGYSQLNGSLNITQKAISDKLIFDLTMGATERESQLGFPEVFKYAAIYNPTSPVKSNEPAYTEYDGYTQQLNFDYYNPVAILESDRNDENTSNLNISLKGTYEIFKGLNVDALYAVRNTGLTGGKYFDKNELWGGYYTNGMASRQQDNSSSRLFESTIHLNEDISSALNLNFTGGYSYQDFTNEGFFASTGNFLTDDFSYNNLSAGLDIKNGKGTITSYKNSNSLAAFFGRINLTISNFWFVSATARYEGSSRFGSANKWALFHSLGAGIDMSKILRIKALDYFKLRMDYGLTGTQPANSYESLEHYTQFSNSWYNGNFIPSWGSSTTANPGLKSEMKREFDAGFDFSLFKARLTGSMDLYSQNASDLLYKYSYYPSTLNWSSSQIWLNSWKIKSHGMELTLNYRMIQTPEFSYDITFNYSHNSPNIISSLSGKYNDIVLNYLYTELGDMGSPGPGQEALVRIEDGKPIGQLISFILKEIDETGRPVFEDTNKDGSIDSRDRIITGNGLPENMFGFGNTVTYRNWDLNFFFRGVTGHSIINTYKGFYETPNWVDSYNLPVTAAEIRNPVTGVLKNTYGGTITDRNVENASFICLDNMSLGYNFNFKDGSPFNKLRIYIAGNNVFYLTRYSGPDPNPRYVDNSSNLGTYNSPLVPGLDRRETWPRTRSFTIGANVVF